MDKRRLMLIGSGGQQFREYALASISRRASVLLVSREEPTWQTPYISDYRIADPRDRVALTAAARELKADGALTYDEQLVEPTADLAASLGLAHTDPAAIRRCRDKGALRRCLDEAGLSPVRFATVSTVQEAVRAGAEIGYPVVVKPRALGGSIGVVKADNEEQIRLAFEVANTAHADDGTVSSHAGVLIEEFLDGPEYSIDCVTWESKTHPLVLAEKMIGFAPYFEETGHIVPPGDRPGIDEGLAVISAAHKAAGLDRLVSHSEFRLTSRGPRIIEINARLGGDLIPLLGTMASGADLAAAAADVALGQAPDLTASGTRTAAIRIIYPATDIRVRSVQLRQDPASYPGLERFEVSVSPGAEVRLPPRHFMSRLGYVIVTGDNRTECETRMNAVIADVGIDGEELSSE
jgi:biotin carboxylase